MILSKYGCREKGGKLKIICSGPFYPLTYLWRNSLWKWRLIISLFILKGIWHITDTCKCFFIPSFLDSVFMMSPWGRSFTTISDRVTRKSHVGASQSHQSTEALRCLILFWLVQKFVSGREFIEICLI